MTTTIQPRPPSPAPAPPSPSPGSGEGDMTHWAGLLVHWARKSSAQQSPPIASHRTGVMYEHV